MTEQEHSESGTPIYRHTERKKDFEPAFADVDNTEQIDAHIEKYLGTPTGVYHEIVSDLVHVDIHFIPATENKPYCTLVTSGMSDKPMKAPEEYKEYSFAELVISLPASWPLSENDFKDENNYWPLRIMKILARLPQEYDTWLWMTHTIPNGDPPAPYASNTQLSCALLLPPLLPPQEFHELKIGDSKTIYFLGVYPIYAEEMNYKLKKGVDALIEKFEKNEITELLDINRTNVCKKSFWPF